MSKLKDYEYLSYIASVGDLVAIAVEIVHSINQSRAPSWAFVVTVFVTAIVGTVYGFVVKIKSVAIMGIFNTLLTLTLLCIKIYHVAQINHADKSTRLSFYNKCIQAAEKECKRDDQTGEEVVENFPTGGVYQCQR